MKKLITIGIILFSFAAFPQADSIHRIFIEAGAGIGAWLGNPLSSTQRSYAGSSSAEAVFSGNMALGIRLLQKTDRFDGTLKFLHGGFAANFSGYKVRRHIDDVHTNGLASVSNTDYERHDFSYINQTISYGVFVSYSALWTNGLFFSHRLSVLRSSPLGRKTISYGYHRYGSYVDAANVPGGYAWYSYDDSGTVTEKAYAEDDLSVMYNFMAGIKRGKVILYGSPGVSMRTGQRVFLLQLNAGAVILF